jgi:hypothetical protein
LQITEEEDDPQTPHPVQQSRMAVYPNPFNPSTEIMLWISADAVGTVMVYNSRGQRVRTLAQGISIPAETNISIPWDGRDDDGKCVAGGVYYCRFTSSSFAHTRKLLLLK